MPPLTFLLSLYLAVLASAPGAIAGTITLSDVSSDETPASVLDATLDFQITGASQLTLSVTNDTTAPNAYRIDEIFWNATANVTGLALVSATSSLDGNVTGSWDLNAGVAGDGFGVFDFQLDGKTGPADKRQIQSGETIVFVLTISGTGPFTMDDFTMELTTVPPGDQATLAAAKFIRGPGDDSAFGGTVPEPASALLLGGALLGLFARRRARGA